MYLQQDNRKIRKKTDELNNQTTQVRQRGYNTLTGSSTNESTCLNPANSTTTKIQASTEVAVRQAQIPSHSRLLRKFQLQPATAVRQAQITSQTRLLSTRHHRTSCTMASLADKLHGHTGTQNQKRRQGQNRHQGQQHNRRPPK